MTKIRTANLSKKHEIADLVVEQPFYKDVDLPQLYSAAKELVHAKTGGVLKGVFDESEEGDEYDSKNEKNQHVADWLLASARLQESMSVQGVDVEM